MDSPTIEFNKIVCERGEGQMLTATAYLSIETSDTISKSALVRARLRLEDKRGSMIRDFTGARMGGDTPYFAISVTMGIYATEWDEMQELMRFRGEIEELVKVPCCIDCSKLTRPKPQKKPTFPHKRITR